MGEKDPGGQEALDYVPSTNISFQENKKNMCSKSFWIPAQPRHGFEGCL